MSPKVNRLLIAQYVWVQQYSPYVFLVVIYSVSCAWKEQHDKQKNVQCVVSQYPLTLIKTQLYLSVMNWKYSMTVINGFMKAKMVRIYWLTCLMYCDNNNMDNFPVGWWQYEKRTSEEIEQNHKLNNKKFDLLICGTIYTIDLERNVQYNRENPNRRRKVKRENANNIAVKGVAGVHWYYYIKYLHFFFCK